jgi:hypothetical protein
VKLKFLGTGVSDLGMHDNEMLTSLWWGPRSLHQLPSDADSLDRQGL